MRANDDLVPSNQWVRRGLHFAPKNGIGSSYTFWGTTYYTPSEITVSGKKLFPGIKFYASSNSGLSDDFDDDNLASFELCGREYCLFMNNDNKGKFSSFTVNVPNYCYLWIEAMTNVSEPNTSLASDGLSFEVVSSNGTHIETTNRYDRYTTSSQNPQEYNKHIFTYYTWDKGGDYTITPSRACYVYYIAVLPHASFVFDFPAQNKTLNVGETTNNKPTIYWTNYTVYPANIAKNNNDNKKVDLLDESSVTYSSDDETVATVDQDGKVTAVGAGKATITATIKEGEKFGSDRSIELVYTCSDSYTVTVNAPSNLITDQVASNDKVSTIWQKKEFKASNQTKLNLYLGGWKYQKDSGLASFYEGKGVYDSRTNTWSLPSGYTGSEGKSKTDQWKDASVYNVGKRTPKEYQSVPIDDYEYFKAGDQNGKCEFLYGDNTDNNVNLLLAGDYELEFDERHPNVTDWETTRNNNHFKDYTEGKGNPFTVPCFGSFIKLEPECNGTATLYLIQNGTIDYYSGNDDDPYGNTLLETIGWRPVYIVDEGGNRLPSEDVKAVTKQMSMVSREDVTTDVYTKDSNSKYNVSLVKDGGKAKTYWQAVQDYKDPNTGECIYDSHQHVFDKYWNRRGEPEQVLSPDITGDGWVVISKAYVKYQFKVKAGKSYYVFANKSAISYCGATFLYDDAPSGDYTFNEDGTIKNNNSNQTYSNINELLGNNESITVNSITVKNANGFHKGWNSICLPFSITESKMREIFGTKTNIGTIYSPKYRYNEDYEVLIFNGCTKVENLKEDDDYTDKVHFFHHVYQDIIAGYPYMIWIPKDADRKGKNEFKVEKVTIEKESLNNRPTISTSTQYMPEKSGLAQHSPIDDFTFTGVYNPTKIPKDSYCVVEEGIKIYDEVELPGYRAYLHPSYKNNGSTYEVKRISATNLNEMTYIWDEATPIKSILADVMPDNGFSVPSDVYNVSGMLVRKNSTSLEGLPTGIYIVNGKKYFVK